MLTKKYFDDLTRKIIGAAIEVHKKLGPGLLEKVYQKCLEREFQLCGIKAISEEIVPINYKGQTLESDLRADFIVENCFIVEIKAVQEMNPIFDAQVISYMKMKKSPKGIIINFHVKNIFYEGQKTFVNELYRDLPDQ
jgi:GxxExxY protein